MDGIACTPKGYDKADFEGGFASYLTPYGGKNRVSAPTTQQNSIINNLEENSAATGTPAVRIKMSPSHWKKSIVAV